MLMLSISPLTIGACDCLVVVVAKSNQVLKWLVLEMLIGLMVYFKLFV